MPFQIGSAYGKIEIDASGVINSTRAAQASMQQFDQAAGRSLSQFRNLSEGWAQGASRADVARSALAGLEQKFQSGDMNALQYQRAISQVQTQFGLTSNGSRKAAVEVQGLNERFAKGEIDARQYAAGLEKVYTTFDKSQISLKSVGQQMTGIGDKMSVGVTLPLMAVGTAAIKASSDLNETASKTQVLFGSMTGQVNAWAEKADVSFGQSKKQALDAASTFSMFGQSAGLAGEDLMKFAQQNTEMASDMASFFNTSPEDAIVAIGAAFRGETEPIRRYNVMLNDAAMRDQALRMGLIKTTSEALTPQQKVLAAHALIMQQTSAAQGDFGRTSGELANQTRIMNAQLQNALAELGTSLLPIMKQGVDIVRSLLSAFQSLPKPMQDIIVAFGMMAAAAGPVLSIGGRILPVIGDMTKEFGLLITKTGSTKAALLELGVSAAPVIAIIAGMVAIMTYLDRVGKAAQATNDDLVKMANSNTGNVLEDTFNRAAASTEILTNGQNRIRAALDGVNEKLKTSADGYADYRSSIEATAKAAGYEIDAMGNLIQVSYGMGGRIEHLVQANYALTKATFGAEKGTGALGVAFDRMKEAGGQFIALVAPQVKAAQDAGAAVDTMALRYEALGKSIVAGNTAAEKSMEVLKIAMAGAVTKELTDYNDKQGEAKKKLAEVKEELDKLTAAQGRAVTSTAKGTMTETERAAATARLAALQETYTAGVRKKNETDLQYQSRMAATAASIEDVNNKLGEAIGATTSYVDNSKKIAELKGTYDELNGQIRKNAEEHELATKRILFDIAAQQLATIQDPQLRAKAMNELALQWGLVDKATYDATTKIIGYTADLAKDQNVDMFKAKMQGISTGILDPNAAKDAAEMARGKAEDMLSSKPVTMKVTADTKPAEESVAGMTRAEKKEMALGVTADTKPAQASVDEMAQQLNTRPPIEMKVTTKIVTEEEIKGAAGDSMEERRAQAQSQAKQTAGLVAAATTEMTTTVKKAVDEVDTAGGKMAGSVQGNASKAVTSMGIAARTMIEATGSAVKGAASSIEASGDVAIPMIARIIAALNEIPRTIDVKVNVVGGGGIPEMAEGGPVMGGRAYVVGERRPELFVPWTDGVILPQVPSFDSAALRSGRGSEVVKSTQVVYNSQNNFYDATATKVYLEQQRLQRIRDMAMEM
jgi:hypothetical protein